MLLRFESGRFDERDCVAQGEALAESYQSAKPYPHVVIDDIVPAEPLLDIVRHFPNRTGVTSFDRDQERAKFQFPPWKCAKSISDTLDAFNSRPFLMFLEAMTGIQGLIPDPDFSGGGLHEVLSGGKLGVHADFPLHQRLNLRRRLNLLIYLNEDWPAEYGGNLELWDRRMKAAQVSVRPLFGRAVVFTTDLDTYHGHPDPLTCPPDVSRKSIALYYYTSDTDLVPNRTTNFMRRPGSDDKVDWKYKKMHFIEDWVPKGLRRALRRLRG